MPRGELELGEHAEGLDVGQRERDAAVLELHVAEGFI